MEVLAEFDVAVIGAGHAGIEAAVASARRGCRTALFTISLDQIGNMPCNPAIGGSAKGHLVREIDALGGVMGKAADQCCMQMRMLNLSKGASVHSPRAQEDRLEYHKLTKEICETTPNLRVIQTEIADIIIENGYVTGVVNTYGSVYRCKAAVICTGTFLNGKVYIGRNEKESGPDSCLPAKSLSVSLERAGIVLRRFKTGTPCRVHAKSIDYTKLLPQTGDPNPLPFSFENKRGIIRNDAVCYIANTNAKTHEVIRSHIGDSPLYSGMIHGIGPRYCPSIEDKVIRFHERERHQIFVEPTGYHTKEMYLGGFSTSLPEHVQLEMLRTVSGFEHIEIMRSAYAIEYDCVNPVCLNHTLEFQQIHGLFSAGQFNGTSGYEEAAAQGLIAGINASAYVLDEKFLELPRSSSYIGTLIDDLVTKGTDDPYRMMTARSEYRLSLRHGTADLRLTPIGREYRLISDERWAAYCAKQERINNAFAQILDYSVPISQSLNDYLNAAETSAISQSVKMDSLVRRPQVSLEMLCEAVKLNLKLDSDELAEVELRIKYDQYIERQNRQNDKAEHLAKIKLQNDVDYTKIHGISSEAAEKLAKHRPDNLASASRISGVSPADLNILIAWLKAGGYHV